MAEPMNPLEMLFRQHRQQEEESAPPINPDIKAELLLEAVRQYETVHLFDKYQIIRQKRACYRYPAVNEPAIYIREMIPGEFEEDVPEYQPFNAMIGILDPQGQLHFILVDIQRFEPYSEEDMKKVITESLENKKDKGC